MDHGDSERIRALGRGFDSPFQRDRDWTVERIDRRWRPPRRLGPTLERGRSTPAPTFFSRFLVRPMRLAWPTAPSSSEEGGRTKTFETEESAAVRGPSTHASIRVWRFCVLAPRSRIEDAPQLEFPGVLQLIRNREATGSSIWDFGEGGL